MLAIQSIQILAILSILAGEPGRAGHTNPFASPESRFTGGGMETKGRRSQWDVILVCEIPIEEKAPQGLKFVSYSSY